jgi:hypothetical protein
MTIKDKKKGKPEEMLGNTSSLYPINRQRFIICPDPDTTYNQAATTRNQMRGRRISTSYQEQTQGR